MPKQSTTQKIVTKKHIARLERERRQVNIIRAVAFAGILIVIGLLGYGFIRSNVLADVNGVKITAGPWQERVKFQRIQMINLYNQYVFYQQNFGFDYSQQLQQIGTVLQSPESLGQQVLDQMVDEELIRQEAKKLGISVSEAEVKASIEENFAFFPNGTPTPTVTPTELSFPTLTSQQLTLYPPTGTPTEVLPPTLEPTATLDPSMTPPPSETPLPTLTAAPPTPTFVPELPTMSPTPYTVEGFNAEYAKMLESYDEYNISEETIQLVYEAGLLRQKLLDEVTKDVPRTEEQVWARHILVETEEAAKDIYEKATKPGADFAEIAREASKDTGSGAMGGDLGWFGRGQMVPEFEKTAFNLEVGQISEPIQSQFGYHIIQTLGHQEIPLDAGQYEQKRETEFSNWLVTARAKATIKTFDVWQNRVPMEPSLESQPQQ